MLRQLDEPRCSTRAGLTLHRVEPGFGVVDVLAGGVGVANAAASTAVALALADYDLVLSVGIAGGVAPAPIGAVVVADTVVHADLGAEDGPQFLPVSQLGLGTERFDLDAAVTAELVRRCSTPADPARVGAVLSVSTVTGSVATLTQRHRRHRDAVAEAMEGAGVLAAARRYGVAFGEVRTISNTVGPRDRSAWQIPRALDVLAGAVARVTTAQWPL